MRSYCSVTVIIAAVDKTSYSLLGLILFYEQAFQTGPFGFVHFTCRRAAAFQAGLDISGVPPSMSKPAFNAGLARHVNALNQNGPVFNARP